MPGCESAANTSRSCAKRAVFAGDKPPEWAHLIATSWAKPVMRVPNQTAPMPPCPSKRTKRKGPICVPARSTFKVPCPPPVACVTPNKAPGVSASGRPVSSIAASKRSTSSRSSGSGQFTFKNAARSAASTSSASRNIWTRFGFMATMLRIKPPNFW